MLRYVEAGLSDLEVPQEISLCIYLSGCIYRCEHCHYQDLQAPDGGNLLAENFEPLFLAYQAYMTCLCFLGEGSACDQHELLHYVEYAHAKNVKSCLYTGKEQLEDWMQLCKNWKVSAAKRAFMERNDQSAYVCQAP